ncbi:MAG: FtsX-like permease family protein [Clostridia bacterium]|nr:MAG: FtsX-like permease family protein [Clostridia bacterium]
MALRLALAGIVANKLRSVLTVLGVVIGVAAVIALVALGEGATRQVSQQIQGLGSNLVTATIFGRGSNLPLDYKEAVDLGTRAGAAGVAPVLSGRATLKHGNQNMDTSIEGSGPDYLQVRNFSLARGRFLMSVDLDQRQRVAVLGADVVSELFGVLDPLGEDIRINGLPFTVVGVLAAKGGGQDSVVVIPATTAARLMHSPGVRTLYLAAPTSETVDMVSARLEALLLRRYRDENAFRLFSQTQMLETVGQVTGTLTLMLAGIAGISLLVGGIGIMNIMLVSVTERTREIGIRKALGARRRDILGQFLFEAATLSGLGGVIGLALGWGGSLLIGRLAGMQTAVAPDIAALAFGISVAVGVFFGLYPASRAASLSPVEALRYE